MRNGLPLDLAAPDQLRLYESVVASMAEGVVVQDHRGEIVAANRRALEILGLSLDQLRGRTSVDPRWRAIHPDGSPFPGQDHPAMQTLASGRPHEGVVMGVHRADGTLRWISINTEPLTADSVISGVVATFGDITAKHAADQRLQGHVAFADVMIDNLTQFATATLDSADQVLSEAMAQVSRCLDCDHLLLFQLSADGQRLSITHEYCGTGISAVAADYQNMPVERFGSAAHTLQDQSVIRHSPDEIPDEHERAIARREGARTTLRVPVMVGDQVRGGLSFHRHGSDKRFDREDERHARLFGRAAGAFFDRINAERVRRDELQQRRQLELQLAQSQRLEAIGRLAGGIAHDFNNMLTVITSEAEIGLSDLIESPTAAPGSVGDALRQITAAANRSAGLTRQLLAFARQQPVQPVVLDVNDKITSTLSLLRRLIRGSITLTFEPWPGPLRVTIDPSQVDQILTNLTVNARDAITGAGRISIVSRRLPAATPGDAAGLASGPCCEIAVSDSGVGMAADLVERIFEPFFTTKVGGQGPESPAGTGLGLASVYGIVTQNHGTIGVESVVGHGTTFRIRLPLTAEDER